MNNEKQCPFLKEDRQGRAYCGAFPEGTVGAQEKDYCEVQRLRIFCDNPHNLRSCPNYIART